MFASRAERPLMNRVTLCKSVPGGEKNVSMIWHHDVTVNRGEAVAFGVEDGSHNDFRYLWFAQPGRAKGCEVKG